MAGKSITPEQLEQLPLSRKEAILIGEKFYFTGVKCKRNHINKRFSYNWACVEIAYLEKSK